MRIFRDFRGFLMGITHAFRAGKHQFLAISTDFVTRELDWGGGVLSRIRGGGGLIQPLDLGAEEEMVVKSGRFFMFFGDSAILVIFGDFWWFW